MCRCQIGNDAFVCLYHLYEECLHSISNLYAHSYTLEAKADLARAMAAGVLQEEMGHGPIHEICDCDRQVRLDDVLEALAKVGIRAFTVTETKDYSQSGPTEIYRGLQYTPKFLPMLKIEAAVPSDRVEYVTDAIARAAKTGQVNDGKIFVFDLEYETRMRMGEAEKAVDKLISRQAA